MTRYLRYLLVGLAILLGHGLVAASIGSVPPSPLDSPLLGGLIFGGIAATVPSLGYLVAYRVKRWIFQRNLSHFLIFAATGTLIEAFVFNTRFRYW
ncbi:MAG: hypothetical protein PVJ07_03945 [Anaerolineales bacterium]|jgi:hypothetical protein